MNFLISFATTNLHNQARCTQELRIKLQTNCNRIGRNKCYSHALDCYLAIKLDVLRASKKTKVRSCTKGYLLLKWKFRIFLVFGQVCNEFLNDLSKHIWLAVLLTTKTTNWIFALSRIWLRVFRNSLVLFDKTLFNKSKYQKIVAILAVNI